MSDLTYPQAAFVGLLQGATELFPISSLGHSVILPALFGWDALSRAETGDDSFYLAFLVAAHLVTAAVLVGFFRDDWKKVVGGLWRSARRRSIGTPDERLSWLLVVGTIPAGLVGVAFEHEFRKVFAKPGLAAGFLALNGIVLIVAERLRRRAVDGVPVSDLGTPTPAEVGPVRRLETLSFSSALLIGFGQCGALFAGISRSGITMVAGLLRGLNHEDAAKYSFMLATPIIGAAGLYKLPDLFGPAGDGVRGQILVGSIVSGIAAYLSVRFLVRYFESRNLTPFGIYCLVFGIGSALWLAM